MGIEKRGKDYWVDYRDTSNRRIIKNVGPDKSLAERIVQKARSEKAELKHLGEVVNPKSIKLEDFVTTYLGYSKNNKSQNMYLSEKYSTGTLLKHFTGKYLHEIKTIDVESYKALRKEEGMAPASINREITCLNTMLNTAVELGKLRVNPLKKLKKLKEPPGRIRYLIEDEMPLLLGACGTMKHQEHLKPIVLTALNTGMRKQEILSLKWEQVDLKNGFIHIDDSKNHERRDVPINKCLAEVFLALTRNDEFVFGKLGNVRKSFETACKKAGIRNFTFHDLRHTFASHLIMKGVSVVVIQQLLGHKKIEMTLRYAHLAPDVRKQACEAIGDMLGKVLEK